MFILLLFFALILSSCSFYNITSTTNAPTAPTAPTYALNIYEVVYLEPETCMNIMGEETCFIESKLELRYQMEYEEGTEIDLEQLKHEVYDNYISLEESLEFDGFYLKKEDTSEKIDTQYYSIYQDIDLTYEIRCL